MKSDLVEYSISINFFLKIFSFLRHLLKAELKYEKQKGGCSYAIGRWRCIGEIGVMLDSFWALPLDGAFTLGMSANSIGG
jgi:hypothetical protein